MSVRPTVRRRPQRPAAGLRPPALSGTYAFGGALARLAAERATGALHGAAGTVYLSDGAVVHAESPSAPGLGLVLTRSGRVSDATWRDAVTKAGPEGGVGRFLVERGCLARGELELCHLGALFDAAYFTLRPDTEPTRFLRGAAHWLGPVRPVTAETLHREVVRRRALLDRCWPWPAVDAAPVAPRPGRTAGVTRRQRAVLEAADGCRTPVEIARLLGRPAFATVLDVRRLAAAGLIAAPPEPPAAPAAARSGPGPDIDLLIRLRAALEAL